MIELLHDTLNFDFPEVHEEASCRIDFQRTLRIPDDNKEYPLPAGLGRFPVRHVDDYANKIPEEWKQHGGVLMPMYQSEALWLNFSGDYPFALKIAAGKINAVTGEGWKNALSDEPQDYVVIPEQPWLDGFAVGKGRIRQFVAMPLGEGYTAEEQITGDAIHGGIQIIAYPMKAEAYEKYCLRSSTLNKMTEEMCDYDMDGCAMGLAPGGLMRQEIYDDPYGIDVWDRAHSARCFIHIVNSMHYKKVTDEFPPHRPPTISDYQQAGIPWFEYYADELSAIEGSKKLAGLDSVAAMKIKKGEAPLADNESVIPANLKTISVGARKVKEWNG